MAIKLYISQANQGHNAGPGGYTEKAGMDAISRALAGVLARDDRFLVKRNVAGSRIDTASENGADANAWGADYYLALHSNAGGPGARGTFGYYFSKGSKGYALVKSIVAEVGALSPGKGQALIAMPDFIELHTPRCPACLIELEAHDWAEGVRFLTGQKQAIAEALYRGVCRGLGLAPASEQPEGVDYRPLKREALRLARQLHIAAPGVDAAARGKGEPLEQLLRAIADRSG